MSLSLQSEEFKFNRPQFLQNAKEWTQKYATGHKISAAASLKVVNTAVVQQLVLLPVNRICLHLILLSSIALSF